MNYKKLWPLAFAVFVSASYADTSVGSSVPGAWTLKRGSTTVATGSGPVSACKDRSAVDAEARHASANYTCQATEAFTTTYTAPPPTPVPPTVTLTANPTSTPVGQTSTLNWSTTNATTCTAGGSWSGTKATGGSEVTAALTAPSTFSLACTGPAGTTTASTTVNVHAAGSQTGLNFPSNGDAPSNAFVAFQFLNPHLNGLPMWGANNGGVTYMWKIRPRQQAGYYATFWWSNNGSINWNNGKIDGYLGAHPYPRGGGTSTTVHDWEIAGMDYGADWIGTMAGNYPGLPNQVVKDRWYTQALRVTVNPDGTRTARFYIDLPSTAPGNIIQAANQPAYFGSVTPPNPALTFGDSPWYFDYQHERLSGVLRGIKIFNKVLTEADMLAEAASDGLATSEGLANVWYMNINPTPDDITDKSGKGHHPVWAQPANKASLWTQ